MKKLEYRVSFTTPAFLGNAEQAAQWRTPPFKALLRQWWRVAYAAHRHYRVDVANMRRDEGLLFGHAWLDDDHGESGQKVAARRSEVRIKLNSWSKGNLTRWEPLPAVSHPEVSFPVDSGLYLGYGPVVLGYGPVVLPRGRRQPTLKANAAIQAGDSAILSLAFPEAYSDVMDAALRLMDRYGTVGGRCRNGWGSISLIPLTDTPKLAGDTPSRAWRDALAMDWPHAVGKDDKGILAWQTKVCADWKQLMRELAIIKIGVRTQFEFRLDSVAGDRQTQRGINHGRAQPRHWLSYPVTNHSVSPWGNNARLPNGLRFKARPTSEGKLAGVIFHVPHLPPAQFDAARHRKVVEDVWKQVHDFLDAPAQSLKRISE
jgi:CRISPR-associated protein Cmr1